MAGRRIEDDEELIAEVTVCSRCHAYRCVAHVGDKESEQHEERWFVQNMAYVLSRGSLTMRSIEKGDGRSNERRTRLHPKSMN